jgi:hypothetical protein
MKWVSILVGIVIVVLLISFPVKRVQVFDVQGLSELPVSLEDSNVVKVLTSSSTVETRPVLLVQCINGDVIEVSPINERHHSTYRMGKEEQYVYAYGVHYIELGLPSNRSRENAILRIEDVGNIDASFLSLSVATEDPPLAIIREKLR